MSETIRFTVPAVPVPQPRTKVSSFGGRARAYTPTVVKNKATGEKKPHPIVAFKATVRHAFAASYSGPPLQGPLFVGVAFYFPRPAAMQWKTKPMPRARMFGARNDGDNLTKAVWDSLNALAFGDDGQIAEWVGCKWFASGDEQPHVEVEIRQLD